MKVKFVRSASSTALENTTPEKSKTMALKEKTALEKLSDVSEPTNVLVDFAATVEATGGSEMRNLIVLRLVPLLL